MKIMPSHIRPPGLDLEEGTVALTAPREWYPRLCSRQASFSAHERDLERRRIHGACPVGAPPAVLLWGQRQGLRAGPRAAGHSASLQEEVRIGEWGEGR